MLFQGQRSLFFTIFFNKDALRPENLAKGDGDGYGGNRERTFFRQRFFSLFPGVPIFFFLSGFLIYGSYESSSENKNPILNFYFKRVLRLYPGLWLCLFFSIFLVWISGYLENIALNIKEIAFWFFAQMTAFQFYNPDFLRGFGGKRACPKASWPPYNPNPSHRSPSNPMGYHLHQKITFFGGHV